MIAYKGFDKDLMCKGFQFEIGGEYEEKEAMICKCGFHACKYPLDIFKYYSPSTSRYCVVELTDLEDISINHPDKVCGKKIKIIRELSLKELTYIAYELSCDSTNTGNYSTATNTGKYSTATNTGYRSAAINAGDYSTATNTGYQSAAINAGDYSTACNTGNYSTACNTGYQSAATNTGDQSDAINAGNYSTACNTGEYSTATNTGYRSAAINTGYRSTTTNTGNRSAATNTGDRSTTTNTGDRSTATNTGDYGKTVVTGKFSIAHSDGCKGSASGALGCWITVAELESKEDNHSILCVKAGKIDGINLMPDVFYRVVNGEFVVAADELNYSC